MPAGACVFYEAASQAIAANVLSVPTSACPAWVDERGVVYTWSTHWPSTTGFYPQGFVANQRWQSGIRSQLMHARYLLISRAPSDITEWDQQTRSFALQHFRPELLLTDGGSRTLQLWKRSN